MTHKFKFPDYLLVTIWMKALKSCTKNKVWRFERYLVCTVPTCNKTKTNENLV